LLPFASKCVFQHVPLIAGTEFHAEQESFLLRLNKNGIATLIALAWVPMFSQTNATAKPAPDVLVFANGDQLTGHAESAAGGNLVFKSDMAGELTIPFAKIKELRSGDNAAEFALLRKGVPVGKKNPVPEGTVTVAGGNVVIAPGKPAANADSVSEAASVPVAQVDYLVPKAEFDKQVAGHQSFFSAWTGAITGGATLVRSTTTATTLTAAMNLVRAIPTVPWLRPRNRTTLNVAESYGKNTSPGAIPQTVPPTPSVTTLSSIFHADAERDEYFTARLYALADTSFDHNYAQGLQLQQVYGGGLGWTPIKSAKQQLDLKADVHYEKQQFNTTAVNGVVVTSTPSANLIGSTIFEAYRRNLPRKLVFTESANVLPAFNQSNDYSYNATAMLAIPVFKRLSASVTTTDNYLNDPAPGYNKNSYQFITGITYVLK
jgi:hypothetical protein